MKNNTIKIFVLGLFTIGSFSCNDLDIDPQQSLSTELAFSDKQAVEGSLLGVYSTVQQYDVYGSLPQIIGDYQADNVDFIGSFPTLQDIRLFSTQADNSSVRDLWRYHYSSILAANAVIAFTPGSPDPNLMQAEKDQFVAEAKFLRALLMFQMVNLFSHPLQVGGASTPGIPLVVDPFEGGIIEYSRATLGEVHSQIQQDLEEAIPALPEEYGTASATRGRATKGAARALLSRLHLYRGEWQQAATYAEQVWNSSVYTLAPDHAFWGEISSELVFVILNSAIDNGRTGSGGWGEYYNPAEIDGRGDCPFSSYLLDAYEEELLADRRFTQLNQVGDNGRTYTTKFPDPVTHTDDSPVIRITEVGLNYAEALAQLNGVNATSLGIINQLRQRAGLLPVTALNFPTQQSFITFILNERRKELAFEGHRRMDLLRYQLPLRPVGDDNYEASRPGMDKTILPIPQREIDINPGLSQNDGY
ncbi:RagB/SusD family nutrient uptake outer membrane protein [Echinicola sediminis]